MNIGKIAFDKIASVTLSKTNSVKGAEAPKSAGPDSIKVSGRAQEVSSVLNLVKGLPETRKDKVEEVLQKIEDGALEKSSDKLASRLLEGLGG